MSLNFNYKIQVTLGRKEAEIKFPQPHFSFDPQILNSTEKWPVVSKMKGGHIRQYDLPVNFVTTALCK
jgi:hypothetical protein